jgi:hypothetical protein
VSSVKDEVRRQIEEELEDEEVIPDAELLKRERHFRKLRKQRQAK